MHNWFQILDLPCVVIWLPLPLTMFSEITISCFPQIPSFLQFSTPNKTFLNTQPAVSFHCYFLSAPILLSFPESSLCYCAHCLILQHRHLETSWHRQKSFERGWGKKAEIPLQLARLWTFTLQLSEESPKAYLIPFASFIPSPSGCCPWKSACIQMTHKCLPWPAQVGISPSSLVQ